MSSVFVAGRSVAYSVAGVESGVPVVFVHGSFAGSSVWRRLISRLDPARMRAITLDIPGWGSSGPPPAEGSVVQHQAAAVEAVVAKAVGEPVHLVGHSHGATVAAVAALSGRIGLSSLTLFEALPLAVVADRDDLISEMRAFLSEYRAAHERGDRWAVGRVIDLWAGPGTFASMSPEAREAAAAGTAMNIREWQSHFDHPMLGDAFSSLSIPTTIVITEHGHRLARAIGEGLRRLVPHSTLVEIAGASHPMIHTHAAESASIVSRAMGLA